MTPTFSRMAPVGVVLLALGCAGTVDAAPIFWTDWSGANIGSSSSAAPPGAFTGQGTITTPTTTVNVTYTNANGIGFYQATGGTDWWTDSTRTVRDPATSPYTSALVDNIPGARFVAVEGGSHAVNLEMPEQFNAHVLEFFAANPLDGRV